MRVANSIAPPMPLIFQLEEVGNGLLTIIFMYSTIFEWVIYTN